MRRRLIGLIYPYYVAITIFSLALVGLFSARALRQAYVGQAEADLRIRSKILAELSLPSLADPADLNRLCRKLGDDTGTRFTLILPDGRVLADSAVDPATMENHSNRPEFTRALSIGTGRDVRHSQTTGRDTIYVAVVSPSVKNPVLIARAAEPLASISEVLWLNYEKIALAGLLAAAFAAVMSWLVVRRLQSSIARLWAGAARFGSGDLAFRVPERGPEEFASLAVIMNRMAAELEDRIQTVTAQRNELEVMLSAMVEAVVVVDREERVSRLNRAAGRLLGTDPETARGLPLNHVSRNIPLLQFVTRLLEGDETHETEISMARDSDFITLRAYGNLIHGPRGLVTHALVVLHDVSRLKKLELVRRDFVANVSHELKTPLTSIKAAVETLKSGVSPGDSEHFVDMILRHADRLNAIIDDLLALSRVEQGQERNEIELAAGRVDEVLAAAGTALEAMARDKYIRVEVDCPAELSARMNPALLEQALTNLLDNAIKYSGNGTMVRVRAAIENGRVAITVEDEGPGIPAEHLDRIFERFYRVDKARSRKLGGTGLGLSIARHIVMAHGGEIRVRSEVGKGSAFTILLPNPD